MVGGEDYPQHKGSKQLQARTDQLQCLYLVLQARTALRPAEPASPQGTLHKVTCTINMKAERQHLHRLDIWDDVYTGRQLLLQQTPAK